MASSERRAGVAPDFVAAKRSAAANSLQSASPRVKAQVARVIDVVGSSYAKDGIKFVQAVLEDDDYKSEDWLKDAAALAIGFWAKSFEGLAGLFAKRAKVKKPNQSSVLFEIDRACQATDPVPIAVHKSVYNGVRDGRLSAIDVVGDRFTIPAKHIRLSVSEDQTFVSLVDLSQITLPTQVKGVIHAKDGTNLTGGQVPIKLVPIQVNVSKAPAADAGG
jgi:hypothetical protein